MTPHTRLLAAVVITGAWMTGLLAQGAGTPPQQGQPPAGQTPAQPTAGRGGDPAGRGAGQAGAQGGRGGGQRRGGFTQYTRELAPQDVIVRGKSLYRRIAQAATPSTFAER